MKPLLTAIFVGTLVLAACGAGSGDGGSSTTDSGPSTTTPPDTPATTTTMGGGEDLPFAACDLIDDAEVSEYLGVEVTGEMGPLGAAGNPLIDDCLWQNTSTFENFSIQVFGDRDLADSDFTELFEVAPQGGIGDEAITLVDDTGRLNSIWAQTGDYILACYPDQLTDTPVEVDGPGWESFLALCDTAVRNAG